MKKLIEKEIAVIKGKQKSELPYVQQEIVQFRSAIDDAMSDKLLLVWDSDNKKVLVYSDSFDEIQKFRHKVEFNMGRKKFTGRRGKRFSNQENTMALPVEKKITQSFSWSQDATYVEVFKTLEGMVVKVYEANILRLDVDCIVNAANDTLQHGCGVALVIANGAGPELDREGNEILKKRGRIKVGEQCVTTAGHLPYVCIIHTVGPIWSHYSPHDAKNIARCEMDLFNSIIGCFFEAEKYHLKSIALPAISSGIFAVPRHMCTEQYAMAVIQYSRIRTSQDLQEIHFIDKLPDIVKDMQLAFQRHLFDDGNARYIVGTTLGASSATPIKVKVMHGTSSSSEICIICMDKLTKPFKLPCGHDSFHEKCINEAFVYKEVCPLCRKVLGTVTGSQPEGTMTKSVSTQSLPGYEECKLIEIFYEFRDGIQSENHPHPGHAYKGTRRTAYLPDNPEGRKILMMLQVAFDRKLVFTIEESRTGVIDSVTWNDIRHKTRIDGGPCYCGYPDPDYLRRVKEQLEAMGVTEADI